MTIEHVLAVVPVADFDAAHAWYERLFGRPADNLPMEGRLVEWRLTETGWVQVTYDVDRAGSALLNFAVDDLDRHIDDVSRRGLAPGTIETVNKGVQLSAIRDPDGNTITFIGNFRIDYWVTLPRSNPRNHLRKGRLAMSKLIYSPAGPVGEIETPGAGNWRASASCCGWLIQTAVGRCAGCGTPRTNRRDGPHGRRRGRAPGGDHGAGLSIVDHRGRQEHDPALSCRLLRRWDVWAREQVDRQPWPKNCRMISRRRSRSRCVCRPPVCSRPSCPPMKGQTQMHPPADRRRSGIIAPTLQRANGRRLR